MENNTHFNLIYEPIDINKYYNLALSPECGAISMFSGITRNYFENKTVIKLSYEAYEEMVYLELKKIEDYIRTTFNVCKIIFIHRLGEVKVSESSILIIISSNHRADSLKAVEYGINKLKEMIPIWKKETYSEDSGGDSEWKENKEFLNSNNS